MSSGPGVSVLHDDELFQDIALIELRGLGIAGVWKSGNFEQVVPGLHTGKRQCSARLHHGRLWFRDKGFPVGPA
jgi:hypothetical protein